MGSKAVGSKPILDLELADINTQFEYSLLDASLKWKYSHSLFFYLLEEFCLSEDPLFSTKRYIIFYCKLKEVDLG